MALALLPPAIEADAVIMLIPVVGTAGLALILTVGVWARQRRLEREAFYRAQLYQRMLEKDLLTMADLEHERRTEDVRSAHARRNGLRLGGLLLGAMGLAVTGILLVEEGLDAPPAGLMPFLLGVVLFLWGQRQRPPQPPERRDGEGPARS